MRRFLRVLRISLIGLAGLALAGYAVAYGLSQGMLNRTYEEALGRIALPRWRVRPPPRTHCTRGIRSGESRAPAPAYKAFASAPHPATGRGRTDRGVANAAARR